MSFGQNIKANITWPLEDARRKVFCLPFSDYSQLQSCYAPMSRDDLPPTKPGHFFISTGVTLAAMKFRSRSATFTGEVATCLVPLQRFIEFSGNSTCALPDNLTQGILCHRKLCGSLWLRRMQHMRMMKGCPAFVVLPSQIPQSAISSPAFCVWRHCRVKVWKNQSDLACSWLMPKPISPDLR